MKKKVIIHIGTEKTGSTYLQDFINLNQQIFLKSGVSVLNAGQASNHHFWIAKACGFRYAPNRVDPNMEDAALSKMRAELLETESPTTLLTSEHFDINPTTENIKKLISFFIDFDVEIICYLRNQVDYIQSLYKEHLKWQGLKTFQEFVKISNQQGRFDYYNKILRWKNEGAKIHVIDFDSNKADLITPFLKAIGINYTAKNVNFPSNELNVSPPADLLELIRLANMGLSPNDRRKTYEDYTLFISQLGMKLPLRKYLPMSNLQKQIFIGQQENNEKLAKLVGADPKKFVGSNILEILDQLDKSENSNIKEILDKLFAIALRYK